MTESAHTLTGTPLSFFSFSAVSAACTSIPLPPSLALLRMATAVPVGRLHSSSVMLVAAIGSTSTPALQCMPAAVQGKEPAMVAWEEPDATPKREPAETSVFLFSI